MPLRTHGRNGNNGNLEGKTNGHGEEDSSNSDGDSSLCKIRVAKRRKLAYVVRCYVYTDDEAEAERRKVDCLDDMQFLEQQFSDLKEL